MVAELIRIDLNLILPHIPTNRSHLSHPFHRFQGVADEKVLPRPQHRQIDRPLGLEHVPEHLPESCGIRRELRHNTCRKPARRGRQLLGNAGACPVEVHTVGKRHLHEAKSKHAATADTLCPRHCLERDRERVGDLILDVLG